MPSSTARATARSRSAGSPRTIKPPTSPHPKASAETLSPVLPSVRYSIPSGTEAEAAAQLARGEGLAVDRRPDVEFLRAGERPDYDRLQARVLHQARGDLERRGVFTRERDADLLARAVRPAAQRVVAHRVESADEAHARQVLDRGHARS